MIIEKREMREQANRFEGGWTCGSSGVGAAIANAICDAIGVRIKEAPITPEVILKALAQKSEIKKIKMV